MAPIEMGGVMAVGVIFVTIHFMLLGKELQSFCHQFWLQLQDKLQNMAAADSAKKQRTHEGLLELRRSNYVTCSRFFVHLGAGNTLVVLRSFAWSLDPDLLPQIFIMALVYLQHLIVVKFWHPKPCHIRWMSLGIYLQFVAFVLLTPRWHSIDDAMMSFKFVVTARIVMSMVFIDTQLSAVCQLLISIASIYSEMSAGRTFFASMLDDVQVYFPIIAISMAVEWLIRSRLEAMMDTAEAETMLGSFRKMLRGVCDGALLLDSDLRIRGSHECLKHLLMTSTNLHGKDVLRYVAEDERQSFQHFLKMSSDSNQKSTPEVAPPCLRVSLCGAMNARVSCDIFHVLIPPLDTDGSGPCHLLALREDAENPRSAPDAVGEIPRELVHQRVHKAWGSSKSLSASSASSSGALPVEDLVLLVDPTKSMDVEQVHFSFKEESMSLRRFMKPDRWPEVQKTLLDYAATTTSDGEPRESNGKILRLHLRFFGHLRLFAEAQLQRFSTATGQVKIRLHLKRLRQKGSMLLEGIDE